ncbi:MAG: hypothetical protein JXB60_06575, partial [Candidatus Cloacimonetes bacterium]|nr:hypothetical protein [Candidatus Cloacimonadota bacterium]
MNITFRPATRLDLDDLTNLSLGVHNIHLQQKPEEFKKISEQNIANFFRDILLDENIILMICH